MICPKCEKEITHVNVISECWQQGTLDGNKIISYGSVEVLETIEIECPECHADIRDYVEET
jgi:Zn finger protein HypA/HybF involved in hydrogenase expression